MSARRPEVRLRVDDAYVHHAISVPLWNLIAVTLSCDMNVRIFKQDGSAKSPVYIFDKHGQEPTAAGTTDENGSIRSIAHISQEILCSVDSRGVLLMWSAPDGAILGKYHCTGEFKRLERLSRTEIAIIVEREGGSEVLVLKHSNGRNIRVEKRLVHQRGKNFLLMQACDEILVIADEAGPVLLYNFSKGLLVCTFEMQKKLSNVAVSSRFIVFSTEEGILLYRDRSPILSAEAQLDLKFSNPSGCHNGFLQIRDLTFINPQLLMVTTWGKILFVRLPSGKVITDLQPRLYSPYISNATVLSDGRICVSGFQSCAIFKRPREVQVDLKWCADRLRTEAGLDPESTHRRNPLPSPTPRRLHIRNEGNTLPIAPTIRPQPQKRIITAEFSGASKRPRVMPNQGGGLRPDVPQQQVRQPKAAQYQSGSPLQSSAAEDSVMDLIDQAELLAPLENRLVPTSGGPFSRSEVERSASPRRRGPEKMGTEGMAKSGGIVNRSEVERASNLRRQALTMTGMEGVVKHGGTDNRPRVERSASPGRLGSENIGMPGPVKAGATVNSSEVARTASLRRLAPEKMGIEWIVKSGGTANQPEMKRTANPLRRASENMGMEGTVRIASPRRHGIEKHGIEELWREISQLKEARKSQIGAMMLALDARKAELKASLDAQKASDITVKAELEARRAELELVKSELEAQKAEDRKMKAELLKQKTEQEKLRSELDARKREEERMRTELMGRKSGEEKLKAEVERQKKESEDLKKKADHQGRDIQLLKDVITSKIVYKFDS